MKNKRKLAVISLVVMMMVTAVGYASFSDNLKIDGYAENAKFDVQWVEQTKEGVYQSKVKVGLSELSAAGTESLDWWKPDPKPVDDPDTLCVSVGNLIPGESVTVTGALVNKGTVHAYSEGKWEYIGGAPNNYDVELTLPKVLNPHNGTGTYSLKVTMKSGISVSEGADPKDFDENFDIQLAYHQ